MNRRADEHIQAVDQTIDELIAKKIGVKEAAERLKDLGYDHDERWAMVQKHAPLPKVVRIG